MVMLHASPTNCFTTARFARMASVEELDSNLTLLTHHSAVFVKAGPPPLSPIQRSPVNEGIPNTSPTALQPPPLGGTPSSPAGSSMMTPPGTPLSSNSARRPSLFHQRQHSPLHSTVSSKAVISDHSTGTQTPQISPTARMVGPNPPNTPTTPVTTPLFSMIITTSSTAGGVPGGPNVVAIDNKIEQAMDLVKTHLTFAVREEVEILRSTIVDLEAKVAQLESQNQVLKQFAPAEVVANLALLVQNAQQQKQLQQQMQQQAQTAAAPVTATAAQPAVVPPAQPVIVNAQSAVHPAQLQQSQPPVGVIPVPVPVLTNMAADLNAAAMAPTVISNAGDAPLTTATASQLSSTLNSLAVNVSSSTSTTTTL